jgi:hypothetical protein
VLTDNSHEPDIEELKKLLISVPPVRDSIVQQSEIKLKTNAYTCEAMLDEAVRQLLTALNLFT